MAELKDEMSKGAISADMVTQAFMDATSAGGQFNGAMEAQSKTMAGQWSTVMDNFKQFSGEIMKPLFDYITNTLLPAVSNLIAWLSMKDESGKANWQKIIDVLKIVGIVIVPILAAFLALKIALDTVSVIKAVTKEWVKLNAILAANPILLIVMAIAALVALFIYLWTTCEGFRNFFIGMWNGIVAGFNASITWIVSLWTGFINGIMATWNGITGFFQAAVDFIIALWQGIVDWFKALPGMILGFLAKLPYMIGYLIGLCIGYIVMFAVALWKLVTETIPQWIAAVIKWFSELPGKIWTWLLEVIAKVSAWFVAMWDKAKVEIPKMIDSIIKWFAELPGKLWTWLVETVKKIVTWFSDMQNKAATEIPKLISNIVKWFADLPKNMLEVGKNVVKGIWDGIVNMTNWIIGKVKEFAKGILDGIKSAMGIKSPSKVTAGFGEYLAQGLGVGFGKEINSVYKQMQNSINLENDKLETSLQTGSVYQNIMNTTPVNVNGTYTSNLMLDGNLLAVSLQNINERRELQYGY